RIARAAGAPADRGQIRNRTRVWYRYLTPAPPPPGEVRVQRGADHPRPGRWMPADRAPRGPGARKGLCYKVLRRIPVTGTHHDREQAFILGSAVELREVQSLAPHTQSTHSWRAPVTC